MESAESPVRGEPIVEFQTVYKQYLVNTIYWNWNGYSIRSIIVRHCAYRRHTVLERPGSASIGFSVSDSEAISPLDWLRCFRSSASSASDLQLFPLETLQNPANPKVLYRNLPSRPLSSKGCWASESWKFKLPVLKYRKKGNLGNQAKRRSLSPTKDHSRTQDSGWNGWFTLETL